MKSIYSVFIVILLTVTVFYSMNIVGTETATNPNNNLDNDSITLVTQFNSKLNKSLNLDSNFSEFDSNLSENGTFDNEDVFAQEYLEGKSSAEKKVGIIGTIYRIPDMFILSLGVELEDVTIYRTIILLIVGVIVSFALFRAFFGGGKVTDN